MDNEKYKVKDRYLIKWGGEPSKCKITEIHENMIKVEQTCLPFCSWWMNPVEFEKRKLAKLPAKWWDKRIVWDKTQATLKII